MSQNKFANIIGPDGITVVRASSIPNGLYRSACGLVDDLAKVSPSDLNTWRSYLNKFFNLEGELKDAINKWDAMTPAEKKSAEGIALEATIESKKFKLSNVRNVVLKDAGDGSWNQVKELRQLIAVMAVIVEVNDMHLSPRKVGAPQVITNKPEFEF